MLQQLDTTTTMKQQVILVDVMGATERLRALNAAHPHVLGVTPHDKPCAGFVPIQVPDEWLPRNVFPDDYSRRCWWACGKLALAAARDIDADHFWMIESDCAANTRRWKALIADHADNDEDCVVISKMTRGNSPLNGFWDHPGTLPWMNLQHIGCLYRLSRKAVQICLDTAETYREAFGELSIAGSVERAGGTVGIVNRTRTHLNCQTITGGSPVAFNSALINHPVKSNTFGP